MGTETCCRARGSGEFQPGKHHLGRLMPVAQKVVEELGMCTYINDVKIPTAIYDRSYLFLTSPDRLPPYKTCLILPA